MAQMHSVWCDAPVERALADISSILDWPFKYSFVVGVHPHNARNYNEAVEAQIEQALAHSANVGVGVAVLWGFISKKQLTIWEFLIIVAASASHFLLEWPSHRAGAITCLLIMRPRGSQGAS